MASQGQPQWLTKTIRHKLTKTPCQSPKHDQVGKCKIQAVVRNKGIRCIHSMVLMIKVTHTMIPELITS
jgi:hypothetical protein